ncbi:YecA family protein [Bacillus cereus]|uniref:YecA family protein n=1 Tax=Bacillus cereus TaxID=1396 RepID=UPI00159BEDC8|nr:SEC-C domain-containing protein [Bacillus cereus]
MLIEPSRNKPCPCRSGKKFKKCCGVETSNSKINFKKKKVIPRQPERMIDTKSFVLDRIEKLIKETKSLRPNDHIIQQLNFNLHDLNQKGNLTNNEYRLIKEIALMNVAEYVQLPYGDTPDYGAMKVFFEFAHQAITERVTDERQYYSATIHVGPGDTLVKWEFTDGLGWQENKMFIMWQDTSELPIMNSQPMEELIVSGLIRQSPYRFDVGIEEFIAGYLDLISMEIENTPRESYITNLIGDIRPLLKINDPSNLENLKELYLKEVEITLSVRNEVDDRWNISWSNATQSVSKPYESSLYTKLQIVDYIVEEVKKYIKKDKDATNKDAILLYLTFAQNFLVNNYAIDQLVNKPFIVLFIDENQHIIDFTITESNQITRIELSKFQEQPVCELPHRKEMSQRGQMFFKTAQQFESHIPTDNHDEFDYSAYCLNYFKCLEKELNFHYGAIVQGLFPHLKKQGLTIGNFTWAFNEMAAKNKVKTINLTEQFLSKLEWVRVIRNLTTHPDPVSYSQYEEVRKLFVENQFIDQVLSLDKEDVYKFSYSSRTRESLLNKVLDTKTEVPLKNKSKNLQSLVPNRYAAYKTLEFVATSYFKVPFQGIYSIMDDRILVVEIDDDSLGYLLLKDDVKKRQGFWGHQFDYIGHNVFAEKLDLQFGNMMDNTRGILSLENEDGIILFKGNVAAKKMKLKVLSRIFKDMEDLHNRMKALTENLASFVSENEKEYTFYLLLKDLYLLIVGANENENLKSPNTILLERFLTTILTEYNHIQLKRNSLISIIRELLSMVDMKEEIINSFNIKMEVEDGKLKLNATESTTQNEITFALSEKDIQMK